MKHRRVGVSYRLISRGIDFIFSFAVILILWWLLLAVWLAIRTTSPGPAIFVQPRVGKGGNSFNCYKFRTMHKGVKQVATHELTADAVTRVGRFMRRTKIDELPQVINILRGDMSLVGPRPCLATQRELIEWRQRLKVLDVRPGITGLAQICGVDMSVPEKLARLDAEYIARRSILLDVEIIIATLTGRGARDNVRSA